MPTQRKRGRQEAPSGPADDGLQHSRVADMQRARLLAAMLEMCAERGAANVTVADVVGRAGVSRRTFYELFSDGEDCLLATLDGAIASVSERVLEAYRSCPPRARWQERMRAGLVALLGFLDEQPLAARLLIVESLGSGPAMFERRSRALQPAIDALVQGTRAAGAGHTRGAAGAATALTAEATAGAVLSVIHARILEGHAGPLIKLANPLMSMIVLPYLGAGAARRELARATPASRLPTSAPSPKDALKTLEIRVTYRTMRVLHAIGEGPGASNRQIGAAAGMTDQGQVSKLLARLQRHGLVENAVNGQPRGSANAWRLTERGEQLRGALALRGERGA